MNERKILKNKYFLYLTEFFSGMSVMAVELGASRLLAPYFSSSQIVWTIIIGTIMIAMALGNLWGGRTADRNPDPDILYRRLLAASVWIAAIPVVGKYVIVAIAGVLTLTVNENFLVLAAFASCMILFVYPLLLLGTVTPSLVKYTVESLNDSGRTVGTLGALNTVGSILGTFLPTFLTIPAVGTSVTFLIFAGILLALSLIYFASAKAKKRFCGIAAALFALCCVFGASDRFAFWEDHLLYEGESVYNYLQVKETESSVILSTNVLFGVQSIHMKGDGLTGMYYDYALAAPLMAGIGEDGAADILVLGMGTGTYATQCARYFPQATVEGVEIDQKISQLAYRYFDLPERIRVVTYDGRAYLEAGEKKYDVIMVDAYQDITIPFQLSSAEFFTLVKDHLKENGVMVVNMNMYSDREGSINDYLSDTIASVFPCVYTVGVANSTNRELFAGRDGTCLTRLGEQQEGLSDLGLAAMMEKVSGDLTVYEAGDLILTDDRAPVEILGMRVIDELIEDELSRYRSVYQEEGLRGLLNAIAF